MVTEYHLPQDELERQRKYIGDTLRAYRKAQKLSQTELGARIGVRKSQISKLESNGNTVTLGSLHRVFNALGLRVVISFEPA